MHNVHYAYNLAVSDDGEVFPVGESFSFTCPLWRGSYISTNHIWTWACVVTKMREWDTVCFLVSEKLLARIQNQDLE